MDFSHGVKIYVFHTHCNASLIQNYNFKILVKTSLYYNNTISFDVQKYLKTICTIFKKLHFYTRKCSGRRIEPFYVHSDIEFYLRLSDNENIFRAVTYENYIRYIP